MNVIKQYIRVKARFDKDGYKISKGNPIGLLVAVKTVESDGKPMIRFGWSLCDRRDEFSRPEANRRAMDRVRTDLVVEDLPHAVRKALKDFEARAIRCFFPEA